jgi:hypothetical protein
LYGFLAFGGLIPVHRLLCSAQHLDDIFALSSERQASARASKRLAEQVLVT